jgi:hypothetical protein
MSNQPGQVKKTLVPGTRDYEIKRLFRKLWQAAVIGNEYNKRDWMRLQELLREKRIDI